MPDRPRTLDEAKQFLTERIGTHRSPFEFTDPQAAQAAVDRLDGLDGERWAAVWGATADKFEAAADEAEARGDAQAAYTNRFQAYAFNFVGRYPSPNHPAKQHRYERAIANMLKLAPAMDPPVEVAHIPFEDGKQVICYLRRPPGVDRPPLAMVWGGIDSWKEEALAQSDHFLKAGLAFATTDMPGAGQSPMLGSAPDAERQYRPVFEWLRGRTDVDGERLAIVGRSFGGYWATKLAHTYPRYLRGAVSWGGGAHYMYQRDWAEKSRYADTYLMELPETRARMLGVTGFDAYVEAFGKLSLLDKGVLDLPSAPMLLVNGKEDTQCPIHDLYILLEHGRPKDARVFPGGHMGMTPQTWPTVINWVKQRLAA
jgi:esterase FrsA